MLEHFHGSFNTQMDHLFISYAIEDAALARWLTLKLTIEGYKVWCFEFKMLGGESFPKEIGDAIKIGTFRMLALLSHSSVKKSSPVKEWTLGQAIGAERKLDSLLFGRLGRGIQATLDVAGKDRRYAPNNKWGCNLRSHFHS